MLVNRKHQNLDFFVLDLVDVPIKDDMRTMTEPLYSLTKKPNTRPLVFYTETEKVSINPSVHGLPTIYDKDIIIYCMSQLAAMKRRGGHASAHVKFTLHEIMVATNRDTSARGYDAMKMALERLHGTQIVIENRTDAAKASRAGRSAEGFHILEWFRIVEAPNGRMLAVEATLSNFIVDAVERSRVLTLHPDYFRISSPLARRIYEIARRHCGDNDEWTFGLEALMERVATKQPARNFRLLLRRMARENNLPDYSLTFKNDLLTFRKRNEGETVSPRPKQAGTSRNVKVAAPSGLPTISNLRLSPQVYEDARKAAAGWDVYYLESEWRAWAADREPPRNPDAAFLAFCKKHYETHGRP